MSTGNRVLLACLCLVVLVGLGYAYGQQQFGLGEKAEQSAWLKRENTELVAANIRIKELTDEVRRQERQHQQDMADASAQYQKDLKHEKATHERVVADLRSGALRLRVHLASSQTAGGRGTGAVGSGPGGCDAATGGELSGPAAEFFVGLASEADEVVHQLTACQAIVAADRRLTINHQGG